MSSFYGNYSVGGGTGGTSDYNDLLNKPFIHKEGTLNNPIVLNTLDYGHYLIKGNFLYTSKDTENKTVNYQSYIEIYQDTISLRKVAKYETFEDGKYYIYTIYFNEDDTCLRDKLSITKSDGVLFISESELPTEGSEGILYITERTIYQWKNGNYIDMNAPQWGEF